jgi:hypothetical protein
MQPEVASDICRVHLGRIELQPEDISIDPKQYENRFVGGSGISSSQIRRAQ